MHLCIYHANCADGFGAAWAVRKAFQANGRDIAFHAAKYQTPPPDVTGLNVIMVDFSYPRDMLIEMAEKAATILILDHHKSAEAELIDLPGNIAAYFDMNHSGAMMAWEYFHSGLTPPPLLLHIEDRDLWRFQLSCTREITAALFSHPQEFELWDRLMAAPLESLVADGNAILRAGRKNLQDVLATTRRELIIAGHRVPAANAPHIMASDAGHELAQGHPFAAIYWDTTRGRSFSLRSTDAGLDVSLIAKQFGGGGHRNAAGFTVDRDVAAGFEVSA